MKTNKKQPLRKGRFGIQSWTILALTALTLLNVFLYLKSINFNSLVLQGVVGNPIGMYRGDPLMKGDTISLDYLARHPFFSAVEVRFNTLGQTSTDSLEFRIKESGQDSWYYRGEYRVAQFEQDRLFPFGFPVITDSAKKTYHIEIESQRGKVGDSVAISSIHPPIVGRHLFTSQQLLSDPKLLFYFVTNKATSIFQFPDFFTFSLAFAMPLIMYLIYLIIGTGIGIYTSLLFSLVIVDIFWIQQYYAYFQISIAFGWILVMRRHRLTFAVPALAGMLLFILTPIFHLIGLIVIADRLAIWTFWFIFMAAFQVGYELVGNLDRTMSIQQYWKNLFIEFRNTVLIVWLMAIGQVTLTAKVVKSNAGNVSSGIRLTKDEFSDQVTSIVKRLWLMATGQVTLTTKVAKSNAGNVAAGIRVTKEEFNDQVTLIVKRLGAPMLSTYLITSRFVSTLIHVLVISLDYLFRFGPYIFLLLVVRSSVIKLQGYANFYEYFFITNQSERFWHNVGYYIAIVYTLGALVFVFAHRRKDLRVKTYYLIAILLLAMNLSRSVYDFATASYRERATIWGTRPEQTAEPWVDVTIVGRNFGEKPFIGKVTIDGVEQRIIDWKSKEIIFRTNPTITKSGSLKIETRKEEQSNPIQFTYTGNR